MAAAMRTWTSAPSTIPRSRTTAVPIPARSGARTFRAQPVELGARQLTLVRAKRATEQDEREIEEMKRQAEKGDLLEGGVADVGVKLVAVAGFVATVLLLGTLAQPVIQNIINTFPKSG
ncbi:hypothetical protein HYH03_005840 [Edaphochlamys debaryana]|uniref:Uncharacterized protein n=1 Tax=Edaphochlamys debaryana TaxID=47281 RepID=A0A836C1V9_9CHLO|nr:hypothetical protein HYH03_005840 [Edaphochlamys debaryana]|eukprot:KAG2496242.1 hypothetical protein HYH03_005840 [Edaphochlamys debaryana]